MLGVSDYQTLIDVQDRFVDISADAIPAAVCSLVCPYAGSLRCRPISCRPRGSAFTSILYDKVTEVCIRLTLLTEGCIRLAAPPVRWIEQHSSAGSCTLPWAFLFRDSCRAGRRYWVTAAWRVDVLAGPNTDSVTALVRGRSERRSILRIRHALRPPGWYLHRLRSMPLEEVPFRVSEQVHRVLGRQASVSGPPVARRATTGLAILILQWSHEPGVARYWAKHGTPVSPNLSAAYDRALNTGHLDINLRRAHGWRKGFARRSQENAVPSFTGPGNRGPAADVKTHPQEEVPVT
jgi:hypothetical protein